MAGLFLIGVVAHPCYCGADPSFLRVEAFKGPVVPDRVPSFYDPGYQLVRQCRREGIAVSSVPGASSLMTLLSLVSEPVNSFYFAGFLPAETEARRSHLRQLCLKAEALVLMDTPYRLHKLLQELGELCANRRLLLGLNLTQEQELLIEGSPETLLGALKTKNIEKAEFILLVYANTGEKSRAHVSTSLHRRNDRDRRHSGSSKSNSLRPRRGRS